MKTRLKGLLAPVVVVIAVTTGLSACGGGSASPGATSAGSRSTTTNTASALTRSSPPSDRVTAQALKFAQCMRLHGVSDYPDPRAPGSLPPAPTKGGMTYLGDSFDPNTPTFQAAERDCPKYAVGLATRVTPAGAAKVQAEQLKYAQCMRSHGEPDFPDPSANGGFTIPNSVDQDGSFFQAAERTCKSLQPGANGPPGIGGS